MRTAWVEGGKPHTVVSPLSLIVSAFAPCDDVRGDVDAAAQDRRRARPSSCSSISRAGRARLGGSTLAQVFCQAGDEAPDVDDPAAIRGLYAALAELRRERISSSPITTGRTAACSSRCARWRSPATSGVTIDVAGPGTDGALPAPSSRRNWASCCRSRAGDLVRVEAILAAPRSAVARGRARRTATTRSASRAGAT